jgi:DNA-binding response OmpR family regulator
MRILLVEDEAKLAEVLAAGLTTEGFTVQISASAEEALQIHRKVAYDAYVLDIMLPGLDGLALCKALREDGVVQPIIMLTARAGLGDKVQGLEAGADDYLTKPFELDELVARIRAQSRKNVGYRRAVITIGEVSLDPNSREVYRKDQLLDLSRKEYQLLEYLMRNRGRLITREMITHAIWGAEASMYTNVIDVFITHLRRKLEALGGSRLIHTVRGKGFMVSETVEQPSS